VWVESAYKTHSDIDEDSEKKRDRNLHEKFDVTFPDSLSSEQKHLRYYEYGVKNDDIASHR